MSAASRGNLRAFGRALVISSLISAASMAALLGIIPEASRCTSGVWKTESHHSHFTLAGLLPLTAIAV